MFSVISQLSHSTCWLDAVFQVWDSAVEASGSPGEQLDVDNQDGPLTHQQRAGGGERAGNRTWPVVF